jgi:LacI family gluconate utilization system Gnt-I transcriptional repressor
MQQVADAAGVTKITVSRYLRDASRVAPATALRIDAALAATGYMPNKQAGMLASGRSRMVAAIVPSIANSVFAETVQGLADGLQAAGYELLLAASNYSQEREAEQIRAVLGWRPDALAVTGRHHSDAARALLRAARDGGTPIVELWDWQGAAAEFTQVGFDHAEVGRAMARHLRARGCARLAYVDTGVAEDFRAHERGAAFLSEAGGGARLVQAGAGDAFDAGRAALAGLAGRQGHPLADGVAFANDHLAFGALLEASARRWRVPEDVALMGFGDFPLGRQLGVGLTTVRPPRREIGEAAARWIVARLAAEPDAPAPAGAALPWTLIERGSTAKPTVAARLGKT